MNKYLKFTGQVVNSIFNKKIRLRNFYCRNCEKKTLFLTTSDLPIATRCLSCGATEISIFLVSTLKQLKLKYDARVYELSYHGATYDYLKKTYHNFQFSEYIPDLDLGDYVKGVRNEDVQRLTFSSNTMDLITSTEVFEHVPDYLIGFSEIYRVLSPGGVFVFTVPLFEQKETRQIARISIDGGIHWISSPEYHDSRVTGPETVPVFWHHSKEQILVDLIKCGFHSAYIIEDENGLSLQNAKVIIAQKSFNLTNQCA
jgi:SAM-dependent methyltransferase